ncbi:MAG: hypothetical protein J6Y71_09870 [Ruminococcus sp.]|nr:hypothetical protein [Ruminococcus sp.]
MDTKPILIVMLTQNDRTVMNAYDVFEQCRNSTAEFYGFKEEPLSFHEMKELFAYIKKCGKKTVLEVVAYGEEEGIAGARTAAECGCDILMGTMYFDSVRDICRENGIKYMPYIGNITDRPSVLNGNIDDMIREAEICIEKGVDGFDLLGYRYTGDAVMLNSRFSNEVNASVCIAGSVNSYERLDEIKAASPWAFTIGGAFFDHRFGDSISEQIDNVIEYIKR